MWKSEDNDDFAERAKSQFAKNPYQHSGFVSAVSGAVYANKDIALAYLPSDRESLKLLENEEAAALLKIISDKNVRLVLACQFTNSGISTSPSLSDSVVKFKLKQFFDNIGKRLNNYVHSNGFSFYNTGYSIYKDFKASLESLINNAKYITISFLFLLILSSPSSIMSMDYIDYCECGLIPPEGSQYTVAPFVEKFIDSHIKMIDDNCLAYLKENTSMQL